MRLFPSSCGVPPPARGQADPERTIAAYAHKAGWSGGVFALLLDWLTENWDQPEEGIWETRGGRKDFTYGWLMSWVAFDRGIRLATAYGRPADVVRWTAARDEIYEQVHQRGWSPRRQAFVQHYADEVLDSSLLRINPQASPDGLAGSEGTFSLCSFLYVDALTRSGRLADARWVFEKMLTYASDLGLYSEEIAATGEQLGNFPRAFTHLALIEAAVTLDEALDAPARAWPPMPRDPGVVPGPPPPMARPGLHDGPDIHVGDGGAW